MVAYSYFDRRSATPDSITRSQPRFLSNWRGRAGHGDVCFTASFILTTATQEKQRGDRKKRGGGVNVGKTEASCRQGQRPSKNDCRGTIMVCTVISRCKQSLFKSPVLIGRFSCPVVRSTSSLINTISLVRRSDLKAR